MLCNAVFLFSLSLGKFDTCLNAKVAITNPQYKLQSVVINFVFLCKKHLRICDFLIHFSHGDSTSAESEVGSPVVQIMSKISKQICREGSD